jgi:hypothetical protein
VAAPVLALLPARWRVLVPGGWPDYKAVTQALPVLAAFALALCLVQALGVHQPGKLCWQDPVP